jgi:hypothetical protein
MLAMAFTNALNEAARDADVIRIFGEGKGFVATRQCQLSFCIGLIFLGLAASATMLIYFTLFDALVIAIFVSIPLYRVYVPTSKLLFSASSLTAYWRWG